MAKRLIYIHGNGTTHWSNGWALWLKKEIEKLGLETFFETFPDSIYAHADYWLPFLKEHVMAGENDIIVGWSSGAVAAMRYAENHRLAGSILVAPSCTDLNDEMEKQSGYYDTPWLWEKIKQNQEKIALFYDTKDPYIPVSESQLIAEHLQPKLIAIPDGNHFMGRTEFPEILDYIRQTY